jgi:hypothetical protein
VTWLLGADTDVPSLGGLLGGRLGAVTIGQALHWMDHEKLFPALSPLLRAGGGIAVVTNGEPLWLQDSDWSRSLKAMLEDWLGHPVQNACGTDFATQERYQAALAEAGYVVGTRTIEYAAELTVDQIAGGVFSAIPADRLPAREARPAFAERIRSAVGPYGPHIEDVRVRLLTGVHPG